MSAADLQGFQAPDSSPDRTLATILWRGKYLILLAVGVALVAAGLVTILTEKTYEARGLLQVSSLSDDALSAQLVGQELAKIYAELLEDKSFLDEVIRRAGEDIPPTSDLRNRVDARAVTDTSLVELKVEGSSPQEAANLAAQLATSFVTTISDSARARSERLRSELEASIADLDGQIDVLTGDPDAGSDLTQSERLDSLRVARAALTAQLARVISRDLDGGSGLVLTAPPTASSSPVRPRSALIYGAGLLAGVLVGFALAWLRAQLDRRIYSAREVQELSGAPVLASIRRHSRGSSWSAKSRNGYERLYANLTFLAGVEKPRVIAFTSAASGPDTASIVEELGRVAARSGEQVVLVDGDPHDKRLSTGLGYGSAPGLASGLSLRRLDDTKPGRGPAAKPIGRRSEALENLLELGPGLSLLAAGQPQAAVPAVLKTTDLEETFNELLETCSVVLVNSPPSAGQADASALVSATDGAVVVVAAGETRREDLVDVVSWLRQSRTPIVGAVVLLPSNATLRFWRRDKQRNRNAADTHDNVTSAMQGSDTEPES